MSSNLSSLRGSYQPGGGTSGRATFKSILVDNTPRSEGSIRFFKPEDDDEGAIGGISRERSAQGEDLRKMLRERNERRRKGWSVYDDGSLRNAGDGRETSKPGGSLSPDAFSGFTRDDPEARQRNEEVRVATSVMIQDLIPMVANKLIDLLETHKEEFDLAVELHRRGVNIRHLGLLRDHVVESPENRTLRNMMLTEMVARTLKNILRSFQRKWMKAERSTSEQGILRLVVEFLNLVTGAHENSEKFWKDQVTVGLMQRFGVKAVTKWERQNLHLYVAKQRLLKSCLVKLTEMQGLVLSEAVNNQLVADHDACGFEFVVSDIQEVKPVVRYMHVLDFGSGLMLSMEAKKLENQNKVDPRILIRLNWQAKQHFINAYQSLPDDADTRGRLLLCRDPSRINKPGTGALPVTGGDMVISTLWSQSPPSTQRYPIFRRLLEYARSRSCVRGALRACGSTVSCFRPVPEPGPRRLSDGSNRGLSNEHSRRMEHSVGLDVSSKRGTYPGLAGDSLGPMPDTRPGDDVVMAGHWCSMPGDPGQMPDTYPGALKI